MFIKHKVGKGLYKIIHLLFSQLGVFSWVVFVLSKFLVGGLEHFFIFHILGIILTNIVQRG
jgi:hypothetical protein